MNIVIKAENISKKYTIGHKKNIQYLTLRETITDGIRSLRKKLIQPFTGKPIVIGEEEDFWALKGINFEIEQGDKVAIIGQNGAGKSTLLKILSRITEPTTGKIMMRGNVAALLEVGTGFHPELTGRENIYLNGSILGMSKKQIKKNFDAIVNFSGVEQFIDTPVKRYSSGMQVRLAFAVSAHLTPDIMIIDEILAVGDAEFQKKCLGKIDDVSKSGRTILFVSHNMVAVRSLCNKGIWLEDGKIKRQGAIDDIVAEYLSNNQPLKSKVTFGDGNKKAPQNDAVIVQSCCVTDVENKQKPSFENDEEIIVKIKYKVIKENAKVGTTMALYDNYGTCVFGSLSNHERKWHGKKRPVGCYTSSCTIPKDFLMAGNYICKFFVWKAGYTDDSIFVDNAIQFNVFDTGSLRGDYFGGWEGILMPRLEWRCEKEY